MPFEDLRQFINALEKHGELKRIRTEVDTELEIAENQEWIKRKIKQEVFMSVFNMQEGFKVLLEGDP